MSTPTSAWHCARLVAVLSSSLWALACPSVEQQQRAAAREIEFAGLCERYPELDLTRGRRVFERVCISCHQADGSGTPRAIPPLRGHVPSLLKAAGGQAYLANVGLYGLNGDLVVGGVHYKNRMPAHGPLLGDADLSSVLAYVSSMWGNDALRGQAAFVTLDQIKAARARHRDAAEVLAGRPALPAP